MTSESDALNRAFYNTYVTEFDKIPFEGILLPWLTRCLPKNSSILEIGSGAGALAQWMQSQGHQVICIEPAEVVAEKAKEKGLTVHMLRFQDFTSDKLFDIVVAISSFIHMPRNEVPDQIAKVVKLLSTNGLAFFSFIEGEGEGNEDPTGKGKNRFFSKWSRSELSSLLQSFTVLEEEKVEVQRMNKTFILFVLKKKDLGERI